MNPRSLETRQLPKRMLGRITIQPKRGAGFGVIARLIFEVQILRYLAGLLPFVVAMFIWRDLALPISQAPLAMIFVIGLIELKVLAIKPDARKDLISDDDMARTLDALRFNALRALTRIAARRNMQTGELHLVVEQSELARVPPLTLVSLQHDLPHPALLDLDATECAILTTHLFDDTLNERDLHNVNLREDNNLRAIVLDTSTISAHARMTALLDDPADATHAMKEPT